MTNELLDLIHEYGEAKGNIGRYQTLMTRAANHKDFQHAERMLGFAVDKANSLEKQIQSAIK